MHCATNSMIGPVVPQTTEWQRIGNEIDAAMISARVNFVKVRWLHRLVRVSLLTFILF